MDNIKISIITPSFNQAAFIEDCLASVHGQAYPSKEHIIIDGGSNDNTIAILKSQPDGVRWVSEKDEGQGDAVNKGFALATGDIVGWMNADDLYYSRDVFSHVAGLFSAHPQIDLIYGGMVYIDSAGKLLHLRTAPAFNFRRLTNISYIVNTNTFFRRCILERQQINKNLHFVLDSEFFLRIAREYKIMRTDMLIGCFRLQPLAKTHTYTEKQKLDERKRKNELNGIRSGIFSGILNIWDRSLFKAQRIYGEYKYRSMWQSVLPYQEFIRSKANDGKK